MLKRIAHSMIRKAEHRLGVSLDYVHKIAETDFGLLTRYNKIFGYLDPNRHVPALAYHTARLRGALAADCGTCVEVEINLAKQAGVDPAHLAKILSADYASLPLEIAAVATLTDAVTGRREDDPTSREVVRDAFGEAGLIELSYAMNGAALIPGIKRAMGYATACDLKTLRKLADH